MKFRNYLQAIDGVAIYPLIGLLIFTGLFVGLVWYLIRMDKQTVQKMSRLPLEDGTVRNILSTLLLLFVSSGAFAQAEVEKAGNKELVTYLIMLILLLVILAVVAVLIQVLLLLQKISAKTQPAEAPAEDLRGDKAPLFSARWWQRWTGFGVQLEDEQRILITGHDYDGIHELDNRMPPWLAFLFQGTILFAIIYLLIYHLTGMGDLPMAELEKETLVIEAKKTAFLEKAAAKINENTVALLSDAKTIEEGKSVFMANCAACHANDGGGTVGPNLTDEYWLHGGGIKNVFKTIKYGVPQKGMISWEKQLNPLKMQQVASYIISIKGSKTANPKAPQGEVYTETAAKTDSTVAMK
ncbi:cbb3-type cytochrome c oxidase N-terminal domain-containing protein [Runella slithyformis]|uniref:Cytochrome c class I n=1 Tax=Runella slithyformis (strain ATCC 29530 / DSM 19594 / LMG 11500 / NCIMB 11436 / LSU 4) TaxID=761193 RepID=A0A7U3ZQK4_RUNSL|nr:cbb3-type cytochrome c oxidase N-terminal domain-containing protein [Runella slithyformis]AEI51547.1 cytochrome c class I [Runella slithyformis DSM 19594]